MTEGWLETMTVMKKSANNKVKYWSGHGFLLNTWNKGFWNSDPPPSRPLNIRKKHTNNFSPIISSENVVDTKFCCILLGKS